MKGKIAIIGSGLIGSCWATLFASAGYSVCIYDVNEQILLSARQKISKNLRKLEEEGLGRGSIGVEEAEGKITHTTDLREALTDAIYAQESTLESLEFKKKVFGEIDTVIGPTTIVGSSSSTIPSSAYTEGFANRSRFLVVHPVNPPLYLPLTELVPAPWTASSAVDFVHSLMTDIGQKPVRLHREAIGFAVNRVQYALLAESWRLVSSGVISPQDLDLVMSAGLGPRYAFYGPFQVIHMNAPNGVVDYCARYGAAIRGVLNDFGPIPTFEEPETIEKLKEYLEKEMPVPEMAGFCAKREQNLARLAVVKKEKQD